MARSFKVYQGEDELPVFDLTEPTSDVHVIWEEIEAGGRAFRGESTSNTIPIRDERGETGSEINLPDGLTHVSLSRGSRWEWLENVGEADETRMAAGRIGVKDYTRGRQKADRAREVVITAADRNEELTEIIVDDWARSEELDYVRVEALRAAYLNGSPRVTTVLAGTYISTENGVTLPAKTYDGTDPKGILSEIAQLTNKEFFVTIDDELYYDVPESTVYRAGLRISDRLDDQDPTGAGTTLAIEGSGAVESTTLNSNHLLTVPDTDLNRAIYVFSIDQPEDNQTFTWQPDDQDNATDQAFTLVATETHSTNTYCRLNIYRLLDPTPTISNSRIYNQTTLARARTWGFFYLSGVNQSASEQVETAQGNSSSSSISVTSDSGDVVLNVAGFVGIDRSPTDPTPGGGQTELFSESSDAPSGDLMIGGGHGSDDPTWTFNTTYGWVAGAIVLSGAVPTFPPKWDVGPASTEDGLQLVSGLRLYYGSDGAYVYVNDAETVDEYWRAERSFYTNDPAIDDSTKATALANSILDRLKTEERTYNVTIGIPLDETQVDLVKPGQLIDIKARAIPDADDQFVSRRIAQLKWTTPVPGVFWAHMQLDRPIKEVPYGIGPKEGHDALEQHKEGDSHPASAIVITDSGGLYTGNDVEAALQEVGAHPGDSSDAHDASAISIADAGAYFTGTDVEAALQELGAGGGGGGMTNPMTTAGDIIYGGASGTPTRLAVGTNGHVLTVSSGNPTWAAAGGSGDTVVGNALVVVPEPVRYVAGDGAATFSPAANAAFMYPVLIPGKMLLRSCLFRVSTAGSGTVQWGLFRYDSDATAATKVAGGSGALSPAAWPAIAASGGPIAIDAGAYVLIWHQAATNRATLRYTNIATDSPVRLKAQGSYTWSDTPNLTSGWAHDVGTYLVMLKGDLDGSNQW